MPGIRKHRVRNRDESVIEVRRRRDQHLPPRHRIRTRPNHAHQPSNQNRQTSRNTQPRQLIKGPRKTQQQRRQRKDPRIQHQTQAPPAQGRQPNLPRQQLAPRRTHGEDHRPRAQHLAPHRPKQNHAGVAHVVDVRVAQLELDQHPGREGREHAQEDDDEEPRHDADDGQRGGEREHAVADDLGDHQHGHHAPAEGFVADLVGGFVAEDVVGVWILDIMRSWVGRWETGGLAVGEDGCVSAGSRTLRWRLRDLLWVRVPGSLHGGLGLVYKMGFPPCMIALDSTPAQRGTVLM